MAGPDLSGKVLDRRYQVVERLSEGAMGVVYRGLRTNLDRPVAIKVMHAALPGAMKGRQRFEREAQLMAKLDHPHCVSIIDFGIHADKPYVVMEFVRGMSLHDMIIEQGKLEVPRAVELMSQVLSGLAHAHEQGIIHRDIKPANIMVTPKAPLGVHARILDFGLARMFGASTSLSNGVAVGTPSYMAPEQCRGDQLDARVDIYACGVVLFEMLTGKKPLSDVDPIVTLKKQIEDAPPRLADVAAGDFGVLEEIVARALAKSPADRFPTAVAMAEALEASLTGRTAPEATAVMRPLGSSEAIAIEPSIEIPIIEGSTAIAVKPLPPAHRHDRPILRPTAPARRVPYVAIVLVVLGGAAVAGGLMVWRERSEPPVVPADAGVPRIVEATPPPIVDAAVDPVDAIVTAAMELATANKSGVACDMLVAARHKYPDRAVLPLTAGKLYFARFWWNDGLVNLREAIRLDPHLREDPELLDIAVRAFVTTPGYDNRLAQFVIELGPHAAPLLDDIARTDRNPTLRSRAAALAKRLH